MNMISFSHLQYVEMMKLLKQNAQLNKALKASQEQNQQLQQQLTVRINCLTNHNSTATIRIRVAAVPNRTQRNLANVVSTIFRCFIVTQHTTTKLNQYQAVFSQCLDSAEDSDCD